MQVTQANELITHAVISGTAQIDMGISNSAEFFQILSSTLYSDQLLAVVRETTCNAWDAHVEAGCTDKPIQITVDSTKVVIRDFGHGIHHDLMGPIYGVYGASTKKNDGLQTGGFGLGCKAPFAYTDHFQVTSNHAGTRSIYSMSRSSAQVGGKPAIIPIASFHTEDTGLEVSINIKPADRARFIDLFHMIIRNGEMNGEINGNVVATTPYSEAKNGFLIMSRSPLQQGKSGSSICVRYGNVIYPLDSNVEINGYRAVLNHLDKLPRAYNYGNSTNTLILQAPPHSISVTPSRETLSMQAHTINTVNTLIEGFLFHLNKKDDHLEHILLKESINAASPTELLNFSSNLKKHFFAMNDWSEGKLHISDYKMYRRATLAQKRNYGIEKKDVLLRIKAADKLELFARGKAHSLYREIQQTPESKLTHNSNWVERHVVSPLVRKMSGNADLNPARLFFTGYAGCRPVKAKDSPVYTCAWRDTAKHARPYVVLHYVRRDIDLRIEKEGTLKGEHKNDVLFYHVPRIAGKVQNVIDFFTAEGYKVIDLTKPLAGESIESIAPVVRVAVETRQQGLIALSAATRKGAFDADTLYSKEATRIATAECVFICTNTDGQRRANNLGDFAEVSNIILNLYGDIAGVAKTQDQYDRYRAKGIKHGLDYVQEDVTTYIAESDIILQHLTAKRTMYKHAFVARIYEYILKSEIACKTLNLPFISETEDKNYLHLWEYLCKNSHNSVILNTKKDIDSLPEHQAILDICTKIANSKYYVFLNTNLYVSQTEFDKHFIAIIDFIS